MSLVKKKVEMMEIEVQGLDRMRELNQAFLAKNTCSDKVRKFLSEAGSDTDLMLLYLKARKNRPEHAWETLKRKAEVRFDQYPEVFIPKPASFHEDIQKIGLWGILKNKDRYGRRVICVRGSKWGPYTLHVDDLLNSFILLMDKLLLDDDAISNGVVLVYNAEGMGIHYARHVGLNVMLRLLNCLWFACPLRIQRVYAVNVPVYFTFLFDIIRPFFSKKLNERFFATSPSKKLAVIHANFDKSILPEYLGGSLGYNDAFEFVRF